MTKLEIVEELEYLFAETYCLRAYKPQARKELRKFIVCTNDEAKEVMDDWGQHYSNGTGNQEGFLANVLNKYPMKEIKGYICCDF